MNDFMDHLFRWWDPYHEANTLLDQGQPRQAIAKYEEFLRGCDHAPAKPLGIVGIGQARYRLGEYEAAIKQFEEAVDLLEVELAQGPQMLAPGVPMPDSGPSTKKHLANALNCLASTYSEWGQKTNSPQIAVRSLPYFERALAVATEIPDERLRGAILNNMGIVHRLFGNHQKARECYHQALSSAERTGNAQLVAFARKNLEMLRQMESGPGKTTLSVPGGDPVVIGQALNWSWSYGVSFSLSAIVLAVGSFAVSQQPGASSSLLPIIATCLGASGFFTLRYLYSRLPQKLTVLQVMSAFASQLLRSSPGNTASSGQGTDTGLMSRLMRSGSRWFTIYLVLAIVGAGFSYQYMMADQAQLRETFKSLPEAELTAQLREADQAKAWVKEHIVLTPALAICGLLTGYLHAAWTFRKNFPRM